MPGTDDYGQNVQYPKLGDQPNIETAMATLTNAVVAHSNMVFANANERAASIDAPVAGMETYLIAEGRKEYYTGAAWVPLTPATTIASTGATALSGWAAVSFVGRQRVGIATITVQFTRTGADMVPNSYGNVDDTPMGHIPTAYAPPQTIFTGAGDGFGSGEGYILADGTVALRTWVPNGVVTVGRNISISATYVL